MLLYIVIIIAGVVLDQLSKQFAVIWLSGITTLPIIPNVLHLTYVENTGAAFSLFSNMRFFLIIVTLLFAAGIGYLFYILPKTKPYRNINIALSLMLSGAIGNLIDRIRLAYVVDFFDFRIIGFAIFNVADILVVCGTGLLIYSLLKNHNLFSKLEFGKKPSKLFNQVTSQLDSKIMDIDEDTDADLKEEVEIEPVTNISNIDITPVVRTDLMRLPTKRSIEFEPTPPSYESFFGDEVVKIYEPKRSRDSGLESNTEILHVEEILSELEANEPVVIKRENRYSKSSEKYEEMVRKLRENRDNESSKKRTKKTYNKEVSNYEKSISEFKDREEKREHEKNHDDWERYRTPPRSRRNRNSDQSNFEVIPQSETTARRIKNRKSKYSNMINSYESLVNSNRSQSKKEEPHWEKETKEPPKSHVEFKEIEEIEYIDTTPVRRNRYNDSTDSYLESIKEAAKKEYSSKNKKK